MQAYGNDYVYINAIDQDLSKINVNKLSEIVSDRHFSIGSDGMVMICSSITADFRMRMFNPDGRECEMCGNALRSVGKYVYDHKMTNKTNLTIETLGGIQHIKLYVEGDVAVNILANIGHPRFDKALIPVVTEKDRFVEESVTIIDREFKMSALSWGNPHCVMFIEDVDHFDVHKYGEAIENHTDLFPNKTNVTFAEIINRQYIKIREWERGTGETIGCGTGCCTAAVFAALTNRCDRDVTVEQIGGNLEVKWDLDTDKVFMKGPSHTVFESEIEVDL